MSKQIHRMCLCILLLFSMAMTAFSNRSTENGFESKWDRITPLAKKILGSNLFKQFLIKEKIVSILLEHDPDYPIAFVDKNASGKNDGTSWENGFTELQEAINHIHSHYSEGWVWVKKGRYSCSDNANSSILLKSGIILLGGFSGTESTPAQRNPWRNETSISGYSGKTAGKRAVDMQHLTMIDGFKLFGSGYEKAADGSWGGCRLPESAGGGIRTRDWLSVIRQCIITNNHARTGGGIAVYNKAGSHDETIPNCAPIIEKNIIINNHSKCGAGVLIRNSEAFFCHNIVYKNTHQPLGGEDDRSKGIEVLIDMDNLDPPVIVNSIVWQNTGKGVFPDLYNYVDNINGIKAESHFNCVQKGGYGQGLVTLDPLFTDPANGDYTLAPNSPCIDAGCHYGPNDPDGTRADIGIPAEIDPYDFPPILAAIPDTSMMEDDTLTLSYSFLMQYVSDGNDPVNSLRFSMGGAFHFDVDDHTIAEAIKLIPCLNWNGREEIELTATDPWGLSDTASFMVEVKPEPDPPYPFELMEPWDESLIPGDLDTLNFIWQASFNVDQDDTISYAFYMASDTHFTENALITVTRDTTFKLGTGEIAESAYWAVKAMDTDGLETWCKNNFFYTILESGIQDVNQPDDFFISKNFPNPFNAQTTIRFNLPQQAHVSVLIYDVRGNTIRILKNADVSVGLHSIVWDGKNQFGQISVSGIYFYKMEVRIGKSSYTYCGKMLLVK